MKAVAQLCKEEGKQERLLAAHRARGPLCPKALLPFALTSPAQGSKRQKRKW